MTLDGLNMYGHRITDQWVFGRGLSEEMLLTLYINVSKNDILLCEILCSNLIVLCLLFKVSKNTSSSCLVPVHIKNISPIYR